MALFKSKYLAQKTISNGRINNIIFFEFIQGKIMYLQKKKDNFNPKLYVFNESNNKTDIISTDSTGEYIILKYSNDSNMYFIYKEKANSNYDTFTLMIKISFDHP